MVRRFLTVIPAIAALGASVACGGGSATTSAAGALPPAIVDEPTRPDDCNLQVQDLTPMLAAVAPEGAGITVERGNSAIAETIRLPDGVAVRVTRGGCHHYGETWTIAPPPDGYAGAAAIVARVARVPDANAAVPDCLAEAPGDDSGFACGEGYVTLERRPDALDVTYSFAM